MLLFVRCNADITARREENAETFALALRLNANLLAEA